MDNQKAPLQEFRPALNNMNFIVISFFISIKHTGTGKSPEKITEKLTHANAHHIHLASNAAVCW
jgi:hypothetical protein